MKYANDTENFLSEKFVFYKYVYSKSYYEYFSPHISKLTGYSPDEINKIGIEAIITEKLETREIVSQTSFNLFSEVFAKFLIRTKDGGIKPVYNQSYNELDENENKITSFGIIYEKGTYENHAHGPAPAAGSLLLPDDYLDLFILVLSTDYRIRFINNSALRYINLNGRNPLGIRLKDCFGDQGGKIESQILQNISGKIDFSEPSEFILNLADFKEKIIATSFLKIPENNGKDSIVIIGQDITGIKTAENIKNMIAELESLNSSKDKLISQISHDLRSPFNSLLGFSEILTTEYETLTKKEIFEYLQAIYEASKNLFGMTNNLLHFSRFQAGRMEFKPEKLVLLKIINKCLSLLKGNAIKKQINISLDVDKKIEVFADEDMLISIIQNLISNAVKFTEKSGRVDISAGPCEDEKFVEISIRDTGIGISRENLKKIFSEKFYSTPGTEKEFGTGLGLILIKDFIEKHNGELEVESKPGTGSTFRFRLPAIH